ncbi:SWPV1-072 [Shearwaterpox virus]|uniref:SWPV1-072 n=1 Tax=Shearwaterpox virus TaxID=1974596 RepID=A0A1V0S7Y0_CNPV|nr:SWPV1-072 [Shearwaterpox virus]
MIKYYKICVIFAQIILLSVCDPPRCNQNCCERGKTYDVSKYNHERCVFSCRIKDAGDVICGICNNCSYSDTYFSLDMSERSLKECISKCPPMPQSGCQGECCTQLEMINHQKASNPNACCDGIKMEDINTIASSNHISCRKSRDSCNTKGYLFLLASNSSVCAPSNSRQRDIGYKYPNRECIPISHKYNPRENRQ